MVQQYEYLMTSFNHSSDTVGTEELSEYGKDGWYAVHIERTPGFIRVVFIRQKVGD